MRLAIGPIKYLPDIKLQIIVRIFVGILLTVRGMKVWQKTTHLVRLRLRRCNFDINGLIWYFSIIIKASDIYFKRKKLEDSLYKSYILETW